MIYLNCTFLCQLLYAFLELFCFQRVYGMHTAEQFGREGRQWFKEQFFLPVSDGIADLIVAAVINTDVDWLSFICLPVRDSVTFIPRLKVPEQIRRNASLSR